ncbi:hypothetical protein [Sinomonas atrocyanea]|uniref:hypothetical protein n=1 Tax=Sinomonas atrocyanea TaxID=37927 RepID=UPI00211D7173|nr:hypothetical protein [Sinomonas atrocyanea]
MPATPATAAVTPERLAAARRAVVSSSIGAALEWFDIIVYASFAIVIAENFFPEGTAPSGSSSPSRRSPSPTSSGRSAGCSSARTATATAARRP